MSEPQELQVALFSSQIDAEGVGWEVKAKGYKRAPMVAEVSPDGRMIRNRYQIIFPAAEESFVFRAMAAFAGGKVVMMANLPSPQAVGEGERLRIGPRVIKMNIR